MRRTISTAALTLALIGGAWAAMAAPKVVSGPGADPGCFAPWSPDITYLQWEKRDGPHKVAVVNGFVGNTWRIQMIQTAKAFAEQPEIASRISEFKVVSTGTDVAAQLGAIEDFINQGFDAIITIAVSPEGFDRVIRLADRNNVVIVPFDNVLDTDKVMQVNENQLEMGRMYARWLTERLGDKKSGKILEVRGLPGNSVDRDRHIGFRELFEPTATGRSSRWSATGTTARRRRNCCWRCSACCAACRARCGSTAARSRPARPPPPSAPAGRGRLGGRLAVRRAGAARDLVQLPHLRGRSAASAADRGHGAAGGRQPWRGARAAGAQHAGPVQVRTPG